MRITRSDYFSNEESEVMSKYKENLSKSLQPQPISIQELIANRFCDPKTAVEEYLDSFKERAGLKDYLKEINAELECKTTKTAKVVEKTPDSLIDIPEVKDSIDTALSSGDFDRTIDILNKLQDAISNDVRIPEDLKGVSMDAELIDYIKSKMSNSEEGIDYSSVLRKDEIPYRNSDQKNTDYFNFESKEIDGNS